MDSYKYVYGPNKQSLYCTASDAKQAHPNSIIYRYLETNYHYIGESALYVINKNGQVTGIDENRLFGAEIVEEIS